jgi:hypothetical protein
MTKLLDDAIRQVTTLPDNRQDDAAHVLLAMLGHKLINRIPIVGEQ